MQVILPIVTCYVPFLDRYHPIRAIMNTTRNPQMVSTKLRELVIIPALSASDKPPSKKER